MWTLSHWFSIFTEIIRTYVAHLTKPRAERCFAKWLSKRHASGKPARCTYDCLLGEYCKFHRDRKAKDVYDYHLLDQLDYLESTKSSTSLFPVLMETLEQCKYMEKRKKRAYVAARERQLRQHFKDRFLRYEDHKHRLWNQRLDACYWEFFLINGDAIIPKIVKPKRWVYEESYRDQLARLRPKPLGDSEELAKQIKTIAGEDWDLPIGT